MFDFWDGTWDRVQSFFIFLCFTVSRNILSYSRSNDTIIIESAIKRACIYLYFSKAFDSLLLALSPLKKVSN